MTATNRATGTAEQLFGGHPDATRADPAAIERTFDSSDERRSFLARVRADFAEAQGPGAWQTYFSEAFDRFTQSPGYTFADFQQIPVPTLILVSDRDPDCSLEEGISAYRRLPAGELGVVPGRSHWITPPSVQLAVNFLRRHGAARPNAAAI